MAQRSIGSNLVRKKCPYSIASLTKIPWWKFMDTLIQTAETFGTGFLLMQTLFWQSGHSWLINSFDEVSPDTFFRVFESACNQ